MSEASDKQFDPTERKLEEAQKKGDGPKSNDLATVMVYLGVFAVAVLMGKFIITGFALSLQPILGATSRGPISELALHAFGWASILMIVPMILALIGQAAIFGIRIAPEKISPKLSRINPIANAGQKFGIQGLIEFAKASAKLVVLSILTICALVYKFEAIVSSGASAAQGMVTLFEVLRLLLAWVLGAMFVFAAIDVLWQRFSFHQRNRMDHKEMRDEHKDAEGDPTMKQTRRAIAQQIALSQMMRDVPTADVVIVNPTHYAVALKWSGKKGAAPKCVAKGIDEAAARIREIAQSHRVPLQNDPPTARAIYATVKVGQNIRPEHYVAVAAAIRFAQKMRAAAKARGI